MQDVAERKRFDDYMDAYQEMIAATTTKSAPWYVVPADHKWWARAVISGIVTEALEDLRLEFPKVAGGRQRELTQVRRALMRD
jgi:polyphosphate kinase 2 (PPK2 family)